MNVGFWGTRGSIGKAGAGTVRYGGNTSCVEVRSPGGALIVLDCGTGAHGLGQALMAEGRRPVNGHLLISHTHWDHIQGIPFFAPLFVPGNEWDIYAPRGFGQSLRDVLAGQMQYTYFPITLDQFAATIRYHELVEGAVDIGDVRVTARYVNHPALTLAYRLEAGGVTVVYATDHEPYARRLASGATEDDLRGEDGRHRDFLASADLAIHDAQYTAADYPAKVGWGHSTIEYVADLARSANVKRLALFHHDPLRDDAAVDRLVSASAARVAAAAARAEGRAHAPVGSGDAPVGCSEAPVVFAAAEGQVIELEASAPAEASAPTVGTEVVSARPPLLLERSVLVAVGDPPTAALLSEVVRADGLRLLTARDGETVRAVVRSERPSLVIVDRTLPDVDALELCRAIHGASGNGGRGAQVVVVSDHDDPRDVAAGSEAGIAGWLVRPFSAAYARTWMRACVLRRACHWQRAPAPPDEPERLRALRALAVLDTEPEERFDRLTRLAAALFNAPIAAVSLVDVDRQWFKSSQGLRERQTPRDVAFCAHAILGDDVMVVPDAQLDPRFADNPLVTEDPRVRFYAGCPLSVGDGRHVGVLCVIDRRPRQVDEAVLKLLRDVAAIVCKELTAPAAAA